jgi:Zn-dependent peptidase ImmA (M78 family)
MRVTIRPELLRWARERAGLNAFALEKRFPKIEAWERGELVPTLRQLEAFSKAVHVPVGFLFLSEPPEEPLPVPDFRTMGAVRIQRPSPDLLDTIYLCQQRQAWYRDYARLHGETPLHFVETAVVNEEVVVVAAQMREAIGFDLDERVELPTWTEALRRFIEQVEDAGVLVMVSGVVGSSTRRKLDPEEFRGLALADDLAPLIFINGADTKAAQMFTLAHELAHIWLGKSGVSDAQASTVPDESTERWCNQVAAELLVPLEQVRQAFGKEPDLQSGMQRLARQFKVSTLVVLRRLFDAGFIEQETLWEEYRQELARLRKLERRGGGGDDFYRTLGVRVIKRFAYAMVGSTLEGQTLFRDAFRMLGIKKSATFYETARKLGLQ